MNRMHVNWSYFRIETSNIKRYESISAYFCYKFYTKRKVCMHGMLVKTKLLIYMINDTLDPILCYFDILNHKLYYNCHY